jgi:hypothetical protein
MRVVISMASLGDTCSVLCCLAHRPKGPTCMRVSTDHKRGIGRHVLPPPAPKLGKSLTCGAAADAAMAIMQKAKPPGTSHRMLNRMPRQQYCRHHPLSKQLYKTNSKVLLCAYARTAVKPSCEKRHHLACKATKKTMLWPKRREPCILQPATQASSHLHRPCQYLKTNNTRTQSCGVHLDVSLAAAQQVPPAATASPFTTRNAMHQLNCRKSGR